MSKDNKENHSVCERKKNWNILTIAIELYLLGGMLFSQLAASVTEREKLLSPLRLPVHAPTHITWPWGHRAAHAFPW
jgi:hypothetical protein